jgi:hypothetical protein
MGKGLQLVARSLDPLHDIGSLSGRAPHAGDVYLITRLSQSVSRVTQTYAANGPAQRDNDQFALCWCIVNRFRNRRNGRRVEFMISNGRELPHFWGFEPQ